MEDEKKFIVILDNIPIYDMYLTKYHMIGEIKDYLIKYKNYNITMFINPETTLDTFETSRYDDMELKSVWNKIKDGSIYIDTKISKEIKPLIIQNKNVETYIFKLENILEPYSMRNKYGGEVLIDVDWNSKNKTEELNKQIKINELLQRQLENWCKSDPENINVITNYERNEMINFAVEDKERIKEICNQYIRNRANQYDVLSRDQDAFDALRDKRSNIDINVVVAVDKNIGYIGHVYTWLSPTDENLVFMIGIRSSPIMPFLRIVGKGVKNVANILLGGVEEFAEQNNANSIVILNPIGAMISIAEKNGFVRTKEITGQMIGEGGNLTIGPYRKCDKCYLKKID